MFLINNILLLNTLLY